MRPERAGLARVGNGDVVVILGAGPIGCLHVRLARARGAKTVVLVDVNQARLDLAARAEPDAVIDSTKDDPIDAVRKMTDGRGADVVITATGVGVAQEQALEMTAPRGRIYPVRRAARGRLRTITIRLQSRPLRRVLRLRGLRIPPPAQPGGSSRSSPTGKVRVDDLITHRMPAPRTSTGRSRR